MKRVAIWYVRSEFLKSALVNMPVLWETTLYETSN